MLDQHTDQHTDERTDERTDDARATIGRSTTIHRASAWVRRDEDGTVTSRQVFAVACGSDRYRNRRSVFNSLNPARYAVDCEKCLTRQN